MHMFGYKTYASMETKNSYFVMEEKNGEQSFLQNFQYTADFGSIENLL